MGFKAQIFHQLFVHYSAKNISETQRRQFIPCQLDLRGLVARVGVEQGAAGWGGGGGGLGGKQEPRKTSLLIGCFVTPATQTQRVYRKTFAETMFLLNPKHVISFSRWEICHSQGTACRQSVLSIDASRLGPSVLKTLITVSHLPLLFQQPMMDDACETCIEIKYAAKNRVLLFLVVVSGAIQRSQRVYLPGRTQPKQGVTPR